MKTNLTDWYMAEIILFGGEPMTRADVYAKVIELTGDPRCADFFAFSGATKVVR